MQFASTSKNRTSRPIPEVFNRACKADPKKKLFLKKFQSFKKKTKHPTQARQKNTRQMKEIDDIKMVATHNRQGTPAYNSTYPKVAVQWLNQALYFYQSVCLVDSEVLRNRHLRVAAKR